MTNHNLLDEYGLVPLASVRAHALTYYAQQTKQAQVTPSWLVNV
jgi:hypothetical protein